MTTFAGIQLGSPMVENSALPLDRKTLWANFTERNGLTVTQRWLGMIGYCQADSKWYKMINEPGTLGTTDTDREEFGTGGGGGNVLIWDAFDAFSTFYTANGLATIDYPVYIVLKSIGHIIDQSTYQNGQYLNFIGAPGVGNQIDVDDWVEFFGGMPNLVSDVILMNNNATNRLYTAQQAKSWVIGPRCRVENNGVGVFSANANCVIHIYGQTTNSNIIRAEQFRNVVVKLYDGAEIDNGGAFYGLGNFTIHFCGDAIDCLVAEGPNVSYGLLSNSELQKYDNAISGLTSQTTKLAIDELAASRGGGRIDYGKVYLFTPGTEIQDAMFSPPPPSKQMNQKDIYIPNTMDINTVYWNCYWDITEYGQFQETRVHKGLKFADINEFWSWCLANLEMMPDSTQCAWNVSADVYDVIDSSIPQMKNLGQGNALFNSYRGRHAGTRGVPNIAWFGSGLYISGPEYKQIMDLCMNRTPGIAGYSFDPNNPDYMCNVFRFPKARRNFYNLLSDEAVINPTSPIWTISNGHLVNGFIPSNHGGMKVLHSQSVYLARATGGGPSFSAMDKEDFYGVQSVAKDAGMSLMIAYLLQGNDGVDDHYVWFLKPVGIDTIYSAGYDDVKYDCYALIEQEGTQPRLRNFYMEVSGQGMRWKARSMKSTWAGITQIQRGTRVKSKQPKPKIKLFLRDLTTGKVGPLSTQTIRFVKGRDRPLMPFVFNS